MARYVASLITTRPLEEVFDYLADFSTTAEWDPGVVSASRVGGGDVGLGSRFDLVTQFRGRTTELSYEIVAFDRPHLVTLRGENATVVSLDTITFEATDGGTRLTYDADLTLKGLLRLGDPLLKLVFGRIGDAAVAGLTRRLDAVAA
jgi:carbon monoxide dehydrogenase subunit G